MGTVFKKAVWGTVVALALSLPAAASPHPGGGGGGGGHARKLDLALQKPAAPGEQRAVIVTLREGKKSDVRKRLEARGHKVTEHGIVNALSVSVDAAGLADLVDDSDVAYVSTDADMEGSAVTTTDTSSVVSDVKQMLAIGNWFTGSTVTVAVIDSGIANASDFSGRIAGSFDFIGGKAGVSTLPIDEYGHGTHVAGLIGSSGAISNGQYAGIAPGIRFLSLRVLDKKGAGKTSDVLTALQFAVNNRAKYGIKIINLSLGHPIFESAATDPLVQAIEQAVRAGIVVVVAAGNYGVNPVTGQVGYAGIASPGNAPSAITVGAAMNNGTVERTDDRVASFSSRGPSYYDGYAKPDVVAPGHRLLSDTVDGTTLAITYPSLITQEPSGKLLKLSGSSMATGVVSGLVAVMIEAHDYAAYQRYQSSGRLKKLLPYVPPPALTPNAIKAMLQYSATPLKNDAGARYDALTQGAGEVDGLAAVTLAYCADTSMLPGTAWMPALTASTQFGTDLEPWSQTIVWGTRYVSGSGLMDVNQAAWSTAMVWGSGELDNIVWGTMSAEGDNIVWGTAALLTDVVWAGSVSENENIVWGTSLTDWAANIVWGTAIVGVLEGDNIVWGTSAEGDNIVWGTFSESDNIVWGTLAYDNIVWGTSNKVTSLVGGVQ